MPIRIDSVLPERVRDFDATPRSFSIKMVDAAGDARRYVGAPLHRALCSSCSLEIYSERPLYGFCCPLCRCIMADAWGRAHGCLMPEIAKPPEVSDDLDDDDDPTRDMRGPFLAE